jgi:tRNA uridine 5-carboxymethylaminomethyl modification enzyme
MKKLLNLKIPEDFIYDNLAGLSLEIIEKLNKFRPPTIFNASQISGITPSAIDILHLNIDALRKNKKNRKQ